MNNAKKLLLCISVLFITLLFQIGIIVKLNRLDNRLHQTIVYADSADDISIVNPSSDKEDVHNEQSDDGTPAADNLSVSQEDYGSLLINSLFIGDSRTEGLRKFTTASQYSHFCCDVGLNISEIMTGKFFIGNEETTLPDAITKNRYNSIFICVGYNELGWDYEDVFIEKYSTLIENIRAINPAAKIYVQAILHISKDAKVYDEQENNDRIHLYNSKIQEMCRQKNIAFIDLNSEFTDENGYLLENTTEDGIHFTSEYYNTYLEKLILYLKSN